LGEEQLSEIYGIKNNPKDVKWDQFVTILEYCGLIVETPKSGSHIMVYHPSNQEETQIPAPLHNNRVKPIYIKNALH
jgi:hypothetical protein